ncbi:DNA repair protein rad16 [Diplodia intermedia]|uniref:DNA repair protein rad16 n=1 Tax=Diplodia intermedia TaxID=856260 RepID=A0ABR3TX81_9PEZI
MAKDFDVSEQMQRLLNARFGAMYKATKIPKVARDSGPLGAVYRESARNSTHPPHLLDPRLCLSRPGEIWEETQERHRAAGSSRDASMETSTGTAATFNALAPISNMQAEASLDAARPVSRGGDASADADAEAADDAAAAHAITFFDRQKGLINVNEVERTLNYVDAYKDLELDPHHPIVMEAWRRSAGFRELKPHQVMDVRWLQAMEKEATRGYILANETGTGKTLTSLAYLIQRCTLRARNPHGPWRLSLILVPPGMIGN